MNSFDIYLSPFSWRYGSEKMRWIWSEDNRRLVWRRIWVALATVQSEFDLLRPEQIADLRAHQDDVDVKRSLEIEAEIHHDLMAELKAFAEQCPIGGGGLHLGATSMDIKDNADALLIHQSLDLILTKLRQLVELFADRTDFWADTPLMALTHLQPAEPTTLGYRLAQYTQDLFSDWELLRLVRAQVKGKGFKGAVGTSAAYADLIGEKNLTAFEQRLSTELGLPFYTVATQVYPRKQEYFLVSALAGLAGTLYKFAFDLRILQHPSIGELSEPFGSKQVGSSAMPFKRNPIQAEKIDSLGRALAQMPRLAWDNAVHSLLERTLDDSANRRTLLPEAFLLADELLMTAIGIVENLQVDEAAIVRNLTLYGPFAATERVLSALAKKGADRQVMHERLRQLALIAWEAIRAGRQNPLAESILGEQQFLMYLQEDELRTLLEVRDYTGTAPQRSRELVKRIKQAIASVS